MKLFSVHIGLDIKNEVQNNITDFEYCLLKRKLKFSVCFCF